MTNPNTEKPQQSLPSESNAFQILNEPGNFALTLGNPEDTEGSVVWHITTNEIRLILPPESIQLDPDQPRLSQILSLASRFNLVIKSITLLEE